MVLLSAQGMDVEQIARVAFTSPDRVQDVINNFNDDGLRVAVPEVLGRSATDVHPAATPADQEDRPFAAPGSRAAVFDTEPDQAGRDLNPRKCRLTRH
jgi:hypothetical protein